MQPAGPQQTKGKRDDADMDHRRTDTRSADAVLCTRIVGAALPYLQPDGGFLDRAVLRTRGRKASRAWFPGLKPDRIFAAGAGAGRRRRRQAKMRAQQLKVVCT